MSKDNEFIDILKEDIHNGSYVMFCISEDGSITMISTGEMSKVQKKICTNMLISSGNHSFILSSVLFLERNFETLLYKMKNFIEDIFKIKL